MHTPTTITPSAPTAAATATTPAAAATPHSAFRELLSELNPLQYLPVIGTIYRALTGDKIPEAARDAGSLVISGLLAGPIGIVTNLGALAIEKITHIDPEKIGDEMLARFDRGTGIGTSRKSPVMVATATPSSPTPAAWSPAQLAAYGITATATGDLQQGSLQGADILNSLEFARLQGHAEAQYAAAAATPAT